ncbi:MAG: Bax inhibitor-1/YccA family protein [Desulfovibrionaceae bacterium]
MFDRTTMASTARAEVLSAFMRGVYKWMSLGLLLTAGVAWITASSPAILSQLINVQTGSPTMLFWVALIGEFGLVMYISARIARMSAQRATGLFMLYSALNGLTLSFIFLVYTQSSIMQTFLVCAGMFGAMSIYGMVTKRDLTGMGHFMMMGLFGIIIASVVNMFLRSAAMDFVISIIGVLVFTALTAYDTQKLRVMGETAPMGDSAALQRGTILGALTLYLDFINLFLFLLRFMGSSRD